MATENRRTLKPFLMLALASLLLLIAEMSVQAQDPPKIRSAAFVKDEETGQRYIGVGFNPSYKTEHEARILDSRNYRVSRINAGRVGNDSFLGIEKVTIDPIEDVGPLGRSSVRIYLSAPYDFHAGDTITLYYFGLGPDNKMMYADKELNGPIVSAVKVDAANLAQAPDTSTPGVQTNPTTGQKVRVPAGKGFTLKAAKGRDDANLYFAGDINRASGTDFTGAVDLKIQIPVVSTETHSVLPTLSLKASNDPKADPDTIKGMVDWEWVLATSGLELPERSPVSGIIWRNSGGVEGNRDFENVNLMWYTQALFRFKNLWFGRARGNTAFAVFIPQIGAEIGKNLNSPVEEAEGRAIARLLAGSTVYVRLYQGEASFARLTLDGLYQRRWSLRSEVGFTDITVKDDAGKDVKLTVPTFFGKAPHQWADAKISYNLTEYFGIYAGYQYGQLPPVYKLVDHAFKFGLVFKAKLK